MLWHAHIETNSSLIDIRPTIMEATSCEEDDKNRPGISLQDLSNTPYFNRPILSEYHDGGSPTGMFMLRNSQWKYNYYPGFPCELYDLKNDPGEINNLFDSKDHLEIINDCHAKMESILDPDKENEKAFSDQSLMIEKLGGIDAILNSEEFDFTPVEN